METDLKKVFSWEIDNFSERKGVMKSDTFSSGGCEWCICVHPKGMLVDDHLSLFLYVVNSGSLLPGWRRRAIYRFVLLNQSGKELQIKVDGKVRLFCAETPGWGHHKVLPLTKLYKEGFLENNKLTIEVYMKVVKVVDQGRSTENEMVDVRGFHVLNSQVVSMSRILAQHPDAAEGIRSGITEVKTAYMNILLGLVETLDKDPQSLSETELSNAESELSELTEAGFKLGWLRSKLEEVFLTRKNPYSDLKVELEKEKTKLLIADVIKTELEKEKTKLAAAAAASKTELEKENTKSATADAPKAKLEKEKTKSDTADAPKAELEKEKAKSATDVAPKAEMEKEMTKSATADAPKAELEKEKTKDATAAAPTVSPFGCINLLIKRFFLSCFSEH